MGHRTRTTAVGAGVTLALAAAGLASAQTYVFPAKGQSSEQQAQDTSYCQNWAQQQAAGFNAAGGYVQSGQYTGSATPQADVGGERVAGAARGAARGAAIGAVFGEAGDGAAAGAISGAFTGGMHKRAKKQANQQAQVSAQQQAAAQAQDNLTRAFSACMTGKGYTVP